MVAGQDSVAETLGKVAAAGFAVPRQADTWAVAYERPRTNDTPRQVFTPYNSRGYSFQKSFEIQPAGIKTRFLDAEDDYRDTEIVVQNTEAVKKRVEVEAIDYVGLATQAEISRRAIYDMGQIIHRNVEHVIEVPVEYLMSRKGDLVGFETDVLSRHLEVRDITAVAGADITLSDGFTYIDEDGFFSQTDFFGITDFFRIGETSYAAIVNAAGVSVRKITAWNSGTLTATLASAPTAADVGDRFIIGLGENVYRRMLIRSIEPIKNLEARLSLVDEAPTLVSTLIGS